MEWFTLALISSITLSLREFFVKKSGQLISPMLLSWWNNVIMFAILLVLVLVSSDYHAVTRSYLAVLITAAILDSLAAVLYFHAIKTGDLSRTIPMLCFIPVVQLFVTPVVVDERFSMAGILGVLIVVIGSYMLNLERWDKWLSPFNVLFKEKSMLMMLGVAVIWGVSSSFHKMGVKQTNALFWGVSEIGLISIILFPFAYLSSVSGKAGRGIISFSILKKAAPSAIFSLLTLLSYYWAIGLGPVAYVSSVRRLGVLFSMLAGIVIFREKLNPTGFSGGLMMIAGALILLLFG